VARRKRIVTNEAGVVHMDDGSAPIVQPIATGGRVEPVAEPHSPTLVPGRFSPAPAATWYGVYPAVVSDNRDPSGVGRVRIALPWASGAESWARVATLMAGKNRGSWFMPDVNDEVLVAFEGGDPGRPYVLGALWNGQDRPPETMDAAGSNNVKTLRSRNGIKITLHDSDGHERMVLETPQGQRVTLQDGPAVVEIRDATGNRIRLDSSGITVEAAANVKVSATRADLNVGTLQVNAGLAQFSGMVKCDALVTNSVVSASYTPGAGNVW